MMTTKEFPIEMSKKEFTIFAKENCGICEYCGAINYMADKERRVQCEKCGKYSAVVGMEVALMSKMVRIGKEHRILI